MVARRGPQDTKWRFSCTLYFESTHSDVREEYLIYDASSFIADVGGFLGLLLGYSIFSILANAIGWLRGQKGCRFSKRSNEQSA